MINAVIDVNRAPRSPSLGPLSLTACLSPYLTLSQLLSQPVSAPILACLSSYLSLSQSLSQPVSAWLRPISRPLTPPYSFNNGNNLCKNQCFHTMTWRFHIHQHDETRWQTVFTSSATSFHIQRRLVSVLMFDYKVVFMKQGWYKSQMSVRLCSNVCLIAMLC